jgi:DNA-binding NtrC family response regulator
MIRRLFDILTQHTIMEIPPLRKRKQEIPLLAEHFLHQCYDRLHALVNGAILHVSGLTDQGRIEPLLAEQLIAHPWEGNVLQLKAFIHSLITPSYGDALRQLEKIEVSKMLLMLEEGREFSLRQSMSAIEQAVIQRALNRYEGHQHKAALALGLTDRSIRRKGR